MTCNFRVGQKVVCVDDMTNETGRKLTCIDKGHVYTIREVGVQDVDGEPSETIWLAEVFRDIERPWFEEHKFVLAEDFGFRPSRFRLVVTRKTDISIFKAMLAGKKQEERV